MTASSWLALLLVVAAPGPEEEATPTPPGMERGLWIGPIRACRDTVERAEIGTDEFGTSGLTITFASRVKPLLLRETTARVGEPMPVRLDGRVILEPYVREPIEGPQLYLTSAGDEMEKIQAAALAACSDAPAPADR